jgi:hypothetical protein
MFPFFGDDTVYWFSNMAGGLAGSVSKTKKLNTDLKPSDTIHFK